MMNTLTQKVLGVFLSRWLKFSFCGWAMITAAGAALAEPIPTDSPIGFFTNVASRLLSTELKVDLHRIQIYPTNQYTPAVHRLLQVTANIYDATTNRYNDDYPHLPTVFRPVFNVVKTATETNVYICDFSEVTNAYEADAPLSVPWDISNPTVLANLDAGIHSGASAINVFGAPWIIGAKKGLPNFNEFFMESAFQLTRKLMVTRQSTNVPSPPPSPTAPFWSYFVMYNLSLTNHFGVECWNSYRSNYTRPIDIYVTNFLVVTLTNDEDFSFNASFVSGGSLQFPNSTNVVWPGYTNIYAYLTLGSFQLALATNFTAVPISMYRFNTPGDVEEPGHTGPYLTTNLSLPPELNIAAAGFGQCPQPHWGLAVTNNLQVVMVDADSGRIVDYVLLNGPNSIRDLTTEILRGYDTGGPGHNTGYNDQWDTNLVNGVPIAFGWQFNVSQGKGTPTWSASLWGRDQKSAYDQINAFLAFTIGPNALTLTYPGYVPDMNIIGAALMTNAMQMPYAPWATVVQDIIWQVNDPLVHYMGSDLVDPAAGNGLQIWLNWPGNLGRLNQRYTPWGGNPLIPRGTNMLAVKDSLVTCSDNWDFPDSQPLDISWLGRVHRGTPWQTVYLKAPDVLSYSNNIGSYGTNGANVWANWTGDLNATDAAAMAPVQDWHLASLLAAMLNTNDLRSLFSVNNPDAAAWQGALDGLTALTNSSPDNQVQFGSPPVFDPITISSNSPQAAIIAGAIETARTTQPGQLFTDVGNILAIPQLTVNSPFLNWNDSVQQQMGINDEAYEAIPSQLLPLLRADSIGSAVSVNGQVIIQFTGYDGHSYQVQVSSNLVDWVGLSTNFPTGGIFSFTNLPAPDANPQFYRSLLFD